MTDYDPGMGWRIVVASSLAALVLGCGSESRTEILVVTDTDFGVPGEIDRISLEIEPPEGAVRTAAKELGPGDREGVPSALGLVHTGGPLGPFRVTATGELGGVAVVSRSAEVHFVPRQTLVLRLFLLRDCVGVICPDGETCGDQAVCRPEAIDPAELAPYDGTVPDITSLRDAGVEGTDGGRDAGREIQDAGSDGGDAGGPPDPDAGEPDGGGPDAGDPDAGDPDAGDPDAGPGCEPEAETCNGMDDDCDDLVDEDFDLTSDPSNCGECDNVCADIPRGDPICDEGECAIDCDMNRADCNGEYADGCEVDLRSDDDHCGRCGNPCRGGDDCSGGRCG